MLVQRRAQRGRACLLGANNHKVRQHLLVRCVRLSPGRAMSRLHTVQNKSSIGSNANAMEIIKSPIAGLTTQTR
jgi:hypothetical protein